jgi:hypothetical protein
MFLPYAEKLNLDVNRKGTLEIFALPPTVLVRASVHLVRKGDLLEIARWKESDLTWDHHCGGICRRNGVYLSEHTSQGASSVSAPGEAEHANAVTSFVCSGDRFNHRSRQGERNSHSSA